MSCLRFSQSNRIKHKADFRALSQEGKRIYTLFYTLFFRLGHTKKPKLGISASKKFGKAHERNYFKRRVREIFRTNQASLPREVEIYIRLNHKLGDEDQLYKELECHLLQVGNEAIKSKATRSGAID